MGYRMGIDTMNRYLSALGIGQPTGLELGGEKGSLNNTNMDKYNVKLEQFCKENGCYFVNVAEALKNEQGGLREEYCSDDYCHLTNSGVKAWIQYLKDYAAANCG